MHLLVDNIAEERISQLEDESIESLKPKKAKRTKNEKNTTDYTSIVGQPQKA